MRIARFGHAGTIRVGVVSDDTTVVEVLDVADGASAVDAIGAAVTGERFALVDVRLLAPIPRPPTFLAIGLNYQSHLDETGREKPAWPVFFNKQVTCVNGPFDPIHIPRASTMVDFEGELGVVIGRRCRHVPAHRFAEVVAGYLVVNDVSVRDWQMRSPTMTMGKSFDTHGPIGPWLTIGDSVSDPHDLRLRTWVNDELTQDGSTSEMLYSIGEQIELLSTVATLEPGTIISTGTPAGVGMVRTPPLWLKAGDVVRVEVEGLGAIENPVIDEPASP